MKRFLIIDDQERNPEELHKLLREHGYPVTEVTGEAGGEEESLRCSEQRYRLIVETAEEGIWQVDKEWKTTYVNHRMEQLLGCEPGAMLGRHISDFMDEEGRKDVLELMNRREQGVRESHDFRFLRCDGSKLDVLACTSPLVDECGEFAGAIAMVTDITERKRAESVITARMRLLQFAATHTLDELLEATLDEAEALTGSQIGFYHFLEADQKTLSLQNWSSRTKAEFCIAEGKGRHYDVAAAGVWVDCIHERRPVIHNDYAALPHRKGVPPGHAPVARELVVPVFRDEIIVSILGVGNKSGNYTAEDVEVVSLLADLAWEIAERKRTEMQIRTSLAEKEILLKEIHHRVKNNLQIISTMLDLQSDYITDEKSLEIFRESTNRIRSIALVHEKLYQTKDFTAIDFNGYLESLADHLFRSYAMDTATISLEIDADVVELEIDNAIPCGLIISELVSNSLKYAFPDGRRGKISVRFRAGDDELIVLTVADDGIGLPAGLDFRNTETLGLQLVTILVRQLRGHVTLENDGGTTFVISFKGKQHNKIVG